jgi:hypothetical protein
MNSICNFSKSASKLGLACALCLATSLTPAFAFPFFHKKQPPAESIPPSAQVSPGLLNNAAPPPNVAQPSGAPPAAAITTDPLQALVLKGVFPSDAATRTAPFSRAEWADIMVKALGHNTDLVSEFPFYRDVPKDYWAYVPIEVAREKRLLQRRNEHGFYYPEKPITYTDVYVGIAQAITGPPPNPDVTAHLLEEFSDGDSVSPFLAPLVAKMAQVRFFKHSGQEKPALHPGAPVYPAEIAPMITYLMHLIEKRSVVGPTEEVVPVLPAGMTLTLSPATGILEPQLTVGASVSFTLVNPIAPLPKGSKLQGTVQDANMSSHSYTLDISNAETPDGTNYQTSAPLTLSFSPKGKLGFFVPGETFITTTRVPPNTSTTAMPVLPPNPPAESSGSKAAPSFSPHSTK